MQLKSRVVVSFLFISGRWSFTVQLDALYRTFAPQITVALLFIAVF